MHSYLESEEENEQEEYDARAHMGGARGRAF